MQLKIGALQAAQNQFPNLPKSTELNSQIDELAEQLLLGIISEDLYREGVLELTFQKIRVESIISARRKLAEQQRILEGQLAHQMRLNEAAEMEQRRAEQTERLRLADEARKAARQ